MLIKGWVYVLTNPGIPGLVKIGFSTKDPALRVRELSTTGVPHEYEIAFDAMVDGPSEVEAKVHTLLKAAHESKEFFRATPATAATAILEAVKSLGRQVHLQNYRHEQMKADPVSFLPTGWIACRNCGAPRSPGDDTACSRCFAPLIDRSVSQKAFGPMQCPSCGAKRSRTDLSLCGRCFSPFPSDA
jgi:hypothetical protein